MTTWDEQLTAASQAWTDWCRSIEATGLAALRDTITHDEVDVAEGLRHLGRMVWLAQRSAFENTDATRPYLARVLGPDQKMGGDNPQGLYLGAPINGTDTFLLRGTRGSARWLSFLSARTPACFAEGLPVFGDAIFEPDLQVEPDGTFEIVVSPEKHPGNWIQTDRFSHRLTIRQFFGAWDDVRPMELTIENVTADSDEPPPPLTLDGAVAGMQESATWLSRMVPAMVGELVAKADWKNAFKTDVATPRRTTAVCPVGTRSPAGGRSSPTRPSSSR